MNVTGEVKQCSTSQAACQQTTSHNCECQPDSGTTTRWTMCSKGLTHVLRESCTCESRGASPELLAATMAHALGPDPVAVHILAKQFAAFV